jgi:hypothetical protein
MKKKQNGIPDFKHTPEPPKNEAPTTEQTTTEVLTVIRQLETEQQNEVIKAVLTELAIDRHNTVRKLNEAADRAGKNMNVFMYNAVGLEKVIAEALDKKG